MNSNSKRRYWIVVALVMVCVVAGIVFSAKVEQLKWVKALEQQEANVSRWRAPSPIEWLAERFGSQTGVRDYPWAYPESVTFPATPHDGKAAADALVHLTSLQSVFIFAEEPVLPDELLEALSSLPKLRVLDLTMANISVQGWKRIGALTNLRELYLSANALTDDDFQAFSSLDHLEKLSLIGTKITAKSVPILTKFRELKELDLSETAITSDNGSLLATMLPNANIRFANSETTAKAPH